jgi:hypothetical protein
MSLSEKRTQIYLPLETHRALKARARRERKSMAEAVREALGQYLTEEPAVFDPAKSPIMKLAGFMKGGGPSDVSENHDTYLAEAEFTKWHRSRRTR